MDTKPKMLDVAEIEEARTLLWTPGTWDEQRIAALLGHIDAQAAEIAALKADNAALVERGQVLLANDSDEAWTAFANCIVQPHPGAALLEELRTLREKVEHIHALQSELATAREQARQARDMALEEVLLPLHAELGEAVAETAKHRADPDMSFDHWNYWSGRKGRLEAEIARIRALKSTPARVDALREAVGKMTPQIQEMESSPFIRREGLWSIRMTPDDWIAIRAAYDGAVSARVVSVEALERVVEEYATMQIEASNTAAEMELDATMQRCEGRSEGAREVLRRVKEGAGT